MWLLPIDDVGYCQDSIQSQFQNGGTFLDLFRKILANPDSINDIDPIPVVLRDGRYFAMDGNRRLYVYKQLARFDELDEIEVKKGFFKASKFTTDTDGYSIRLRNIRDQDEFEEQFDKLWRRYRKQRKSNRNVSSRSMRDSVRSSKTVVQSKHDIPENDNNVLLITKLNDAEIYLSYFKQYVNKVNIKNCDSFKTNVLPNFKNQINLYAELINEARRSGCQVEYVKHTENYKQSLQLYEQLSHKTRTLQNILASARPSRPAAPVIEQPTVVVHATPATTVESTNRTSARRGRRTQQQPRSSRPSFFQRLCCLCCIKPEE